MPRVVRISPPALTIVVAALLGCGEDATSPVPTSLEPASKVASAQALSFQLISAGGFHSCGLTPEGRAYCWGYNLYGQLGDGTVTHRSSPVPVAKGLTFRLVSAGTHHSCGVTTGDQLYCWGDNQHGEVGDGTTAKKRRVPVLVAGGRRYRNVRAGSQMTCAVTTADLPFCWGANYAGQLGDGTTTPRLTPKRVTGGLLFRAIFPDLGHPFLDGPARWHCYRRHHHSHFSSGLSQAVTEKSLLVLSVDRIRVHSDLRARNFRSPQPGQ